VQSHEFSESDHFSISFVELAEIIWEAQPTIQHAHQFIAFDLLQKACSPTTERLANNDVALPLYLALNGKEPREDIHTDIVTEKPSIHPEIMPAIEILRQYPDLPGRFIKDVMAWHAAETGKLGMHSNLNEHALQMKFLQTRIFANIKDRFELSQKNDPKSHRNRLAKGYMMHAKLLLAERTPEGNMIGNNITSAYQGLKKAQEIQPTYNGIRQLIALLEDKFPWVKENTNTPSLAKYS